MQATLVSPANRMWQAYCTQLVRRPLLSRCLTGVAGTIVSDCVAQFAGRAMKRKQHPEQEGGYDFWRTARLCTYSFAIGTPLGTKWFHFLDTTIMPLTPKAPQAVLLKILLDQLIMAPLGTALFFCGLKTLEGDPGGIPAMFQDKYLDCMRANYYVWPLVHAVNFGLVPPSQRILFVNAVSVLWGMVMSHMVNSKGGLAELSAQELVISPDGVVATAREELQADVPLATQHQQMDQQQQRQELRRRKVQAVDAAAGSSEQPQQGVWSQGGVGLAWDGPSGGGHASISARAPGLHHGAQGTVRRALSWFGWQGK